MSKFKVIKASGKREYFNQNKIINAVKRAGASEQQAEIIAAKILRRAKRGMSTKQIYRMAKKYLRAENPAISARYSLREGIFRLGPAGFDFEKYIMLLFREYGYETYLPEILNGKCVTHEVDVIAEKDDQRIMMECKLRKDTRIYINIKDALSTWARFQDLCDAGRLGKCMKLDEAWVVTNSRFSNHSFGYGVCKGMQMLSWNTPRERPLPAYIDDKNFYPVTVLYTVKRFHLNAFSRQDILLLKDLILRSPQELSKITGINLSQLRPIIEEARGVLEFKPNS